MMNDKIKEILEKLKSKKERYEMCIRTNISFSDDNYEASLLLDCITNLQKQIEEYQKALDEITSKKIDLQEKNQRLLKNLDFMIDRNDEKQKVIDEAIKKLKYYSGGEADYYVPIDDIIKILKGDNNE